jgi:hypothetical protein
MPAIGRMGSAIRAKIQPFVLTDQGTPLWRFSKTLFRYRVYEKVPQLSKPHQNYPSQRIILHLKPEGR